MEHFSVFWIGDNPNDVSKIYEKIQPMIASIRTYKTFKECEADLFSAMDEKLILIIDFELAKEIVPFLHDLPQIVIIYIYCHDQEKSEAWMNHFSEVKICPSLSQFEIFYPNEITNQIRRNHSRCQRQIRASEPISFHFVNTNKSGQTSKNIDGGFIHFLRLINVLLQMKTKSNEINDCIEYYRQKICETDVHFCIIRTFEETYNKDKALDWYINQSLFYENLNTSLRTQNIQLILLFGFFIRDLTENLQSLQRQQSETNMTVYRGQWMSKGEVDRLQHSINKMILINSFFSTSLDEQVALMFLDQNISFDDDREKVLFKIKVDCHMIEKKPFANLSSLSPFLVEVEVLFMINAIFQVNAVERTDQGIMIQLTLCDENDHELTNVYKYLTSEQNDGPLALGDVLLDMGQFTEANRIFLRVLPDLQSEDTYNCYNQLGIIAAEQGNYELSIDYFRKVLANSNNRDHAGIAMTYNNLGNAYQNLDKNTMALFCFQSAIERYMKVSVPGSYYHPNLAVCFNNVGQLYADMNEYENAIDYFTTALKMQRKFSPNNYQDIALSYMNIYNAHADLGQYMKTKEYYDQSLHLYINSVPSDHPDLIQLYRNMIITFEEMEEYARALEISEKLLSLFLETLPPSNKNIENMKETIGRIKQKMNTPSTCRFSDINQ